MSLVVSRVSCLGGNDTRFSTCANWSIPLNKRRWDITDGRSDRTLQRKKRNRVGFRHHFRSCSADATSSPHQQPTDPTNCEQARFQESRLLEAPTSFIAPPVSYFSRLLQIPAPRDSRAASPRNRLGRLVFSPRRTSPRSRRDPVGPPAVNLIKRPEKPRKRRRPAIPAQFRR